MKESTKKMLMYGAIILIVVAIVYFAFFRNKDAEHKKETTDNVKSTLEKSSAAKEMAKDKDPVTQAKVDQKVEQAVQTAVVADQMKHDNPEKAKEVAKVADQQATAAVAAAAQIPMAPPMAPTGINTGIAMDEFDISQTYGNVVNELKELQERPKGEAFRYYSRRSAILDKAKAKFAELKAKHGSKIELAMPSILGYVASAGVDVCGLIDRAVDEGEGKIYDILYGKGERVIDFIRNKIKSVPVVGSAISGIVPDNNTLIGLLAGMIGDLIDKNRDRIPSMKRRIGCRG